MQAPERSRLFNAVTGWQLVADRNVLLGRFRQPTSVVVDSPLFDKHLQINLVERDHENQDTLGAGCRPISRRSHSLAASATP